MSKSARIEDKDGDFDGSAWLLILTTCKLEPVRTTEEKLSGYEELEKMMREKIKIRKIDYLPARQVTFPANQTTFPANQTKKLILKKDCPRLKTKGKESSEANVAEVEADFSDFALTTSSSFDCATKWVLDTGCTHHMTPHKDWFSSLKEFDGGVVFTGDDNPCTTKGIGIVRLKLHDGMVKELTCVRYVPNLKKNLISLGTLESKGFRFHSDGQTLKVTYGALVVMKAPRCGHLYLLQGSTVTGESSVVSENMGTSDSDTTRL
ncbi:hypothetical protein EV1_021345 [Malus domestica]